MKRHWFHFHIAAAAILFTLGFSTQAWSADVSNGSPGLLVHKAAASRADDPFDGISFPTIYKSGFDVCTNADGQPVIFLVSSSTCSHCEWVGEIFDAVAMNYMEDGLIEAHHYDKPTGDDLLTEEVETEIPEEILAIYDRGDPKGLVPYVNFSCKYERIGNGHETEQDPEAEGREMMDVIDTLLRILPAPEKKGK